MYSIPGSWMLSVQLVCPVTSRASSLRLSGCPTSLLPVSTLIARPPSSRRLPTARRARC